MSWHLRFWGEVGRLTYPFEFWILTLFQYFPNLPHFCRKYQLDFSVSLPLYIFQLLFPQIRRKKPWACPLRGLYTFNIEDSMHLVCKYYNSVSTTSYLSWSHWCVPDIRLSKRFPDWESLTPPETPHEEKREGSVVEMLPVLLLEKFYLYPLAQWGCATVFYLAKDTYLCSWNKPHHRGSCFALGMSQHFQKHKII